MLTPKQRKCIKYMVSTGANQKETAAELDIAEETISRWKNDEEFLKEYESAVRRSMSGYAAKALQKIAHLAEHADSEQVQLAAAKDILDRSGYKPKDNVSIEVPESKKLNEIIEQLGGEGLEE